jgi:hypothetical protein
MKMAGKSFPFLSLFFSNMKILTWITLLTTAESFSTPRLALCRRSTHLHGEGGTDWIKNAMGEEETPKDPEFTNQEIKEMENLIGKTF